MPRLRNTTEQAARAQLITAAQMLAAHYLADLAARPEPVPEFFERVPLGVQVNCLMVPVPLLNSLARAATAYRRAKNGEPAPAPTTPPAPGPLAADGQDC